MKRLHKCLVVVSVGVVLSALGYYGVTKAIEAGQEGHAKSSLVAIIEVADRTVDVTVPEGRYTEAIDAAYFVATYYPLGTVLPEDHPFAAEYSRERHKQTGRITTALNEATGLDYGHDWDAWRDALLEIVAFQ